MSLPSFRSVPRLAAGCVALAAAVLLAACDQPSPSAPVRKLSANDMLAQVRAAGKLGAELDVQPLRDPQVEDLRQAASAAEARGDYAAADQALVRALALVPNDPDLLQWRAELALARRDWGQAGTLAARSYDLGPKLGGLCRRNWTTLRFVRDETGDRPGAERAAGQIGKCAVTPPPRY